MKGHIRIISLCLALCLLSACGTVRTEPTERPEHYVFVTERTGFGDVKLMGRAVMLSGRVYFLGEDAEGESGIYSASLSGGAPQRLENYSPLPPPEGGEHGGRPLCLAVTADGKLAVAEERLSLDTNGEESGAGPGGALRREEYIRILYADGRESSRVLFSADSAGAWGSFTVESFAVDAQSRIYIASTQGLLLLRDASGRVTRIETDRELWSIEELYLAGDGYVYVFGRGQDGHGRFYYLNPDGPELRLIGAGGAAGSFCGAVGGFAASYIDGRMLYGWEPMSGITAEMLDLIAADLDPASVVSAFETDKGFICLGTETLSGGETESYIAVSTRMMESEAPQKTELIYACCGLDDTTLRLILSFNRGNGGYRVCVRDYSEYNSQADPAAGYRLLESDILAGRAGDIINCCGVSTALASARGRFAELGVLLESDSELRSALVRPVLSALETEGGLYTLPSRFLLLTAFGPARVFGSDSALSYSAALAAAGGDCELFEAGTTGQELLLSLIGADPDRYIDWAGGAGRFDEGDFLALLEFAAAFPADESGAASEESAARIGEGRQLLLRAELDSPASTGGITAIFTGAAVTGLPGPENGITAVRGTGAEFAISAGCADIGAAWLLVRELINAHASEEDASGLPIVTDCLDAQITREIASGMSEEDAILLYVAIDMASAAARPLPRGLTELIGAAAAPYFAGEASAEETALKLNEQTAAFFTEKG